MLRVLGTACILGGLGLIAFLFHLQETSGNLVAERSLELRNVNPTVSQVLKSLLRVRLGGERDIAGSVGPITLEPSMNPLRVEIVLTKTVSLGGENYTAPVSLKVIEREGHVVHDLSVPFHPYKGSHVPWKFRRSQFQSFPTFSIDTGGEYVLAVLVDPRLTAAFKTEASLRVIANEEILDWKIACVPAPLMLIGFAFLSISRRQKREVL